MPLSRAAVAADQASIDRALRQLCDAAKVVVKLPRPSTDPAVGPFSHLRNALKVFPHQPLVSALPGFEGSWLERQLCLGQGLTSRGRRGEKKHHAGAGLSAHERAIIDAGVVVLSNPQADLALLLSPVGPGAAVYALGNDRLDVVGTSVADFVTREVSLILRAEPPPSRRETEAGPSASEGKAAKKRLSSLRKGQVPSNRVHGAVVVGFAFDEVKGPDSLFAIEDFARETGLSLFYGRGDAGNAEDEELSSAAWLVGEPLWAVSGGKEQRTGFELDVTALASLTARVKRLSKAAAQVASTHGLATGAPGTYLVARGGLCFAQLVRGAWLDAPAKLQRQPDDLEAWLSAHRPLAEPGKVGFARGTQGATQKPFPAVVHGRTLATASATFEPVTLTAGLDRALRDAGITTPRFHLYLRFDA